MGQTCYTIDKVRCRDCLAKESLSDERQIYPLEREGTEEEKIC